MAKKTAKNGMKTSSRHEADESQGETPLEGAGPTTEQAASLRDLILSAGAALGDLDGDVPAAEETSEASETTPTTPSKKRKSKKTPLEAPEISIDQKIEWNESTANLDFIEKADSPSEELEREAAAETNDLDAALANEDEQNPFEALARRIAETAAQNGEATDEAIDEPTDEPTDDTAVEAAPIAEGEELTHDGFELTHEPNDMSTDMSHEASAETTLEAAADDWMSEPTESEAPVAEQLGEALGAALGDHAMEQMGFGDLEEKMDAAENDADPEPTEFVDNDRLISVIESLLFSTDKPVSVATIKVIFKGSNIRSKDITRALDSLASDYAASTRGVTLEEINGGYQLRTKTDNAEYLRRLAKVRPFKLSGPSLETMAIIAYRQPITKHEIDEIRGVESGHLLRALMERGMINFNGKSDLPGKPMTYGSTRKFLETFGLRNLRELPTLSEIDEILPDGIGEPEEKEKLSDLTERLSNDITSSYSEGEDELEKINAQLQQVDTTSEFFEQEKQRERDKRDAERAQDIREKIVLGDAVETKDKRWLDRYEAKLLLPSEPAHPSDTEVPGELTSAIEQLTSEAQEAQAAIPHDANEDTGADILDEAEEEPEHDENDDLSANQDWDDESEV